MRAPIFSRRSVFFDFLRSEPDTSNPRSHNTSAMPLIPIPPTPTKWIFLTCRNISVPCKLLDNIDSSRGRVLTSEFLCGLLHIGDGLRGARKISQSRG